MSVIYKALSTIDAAEGVHHAYPGGVDPAAARRGAAGRGGKLLLAAAVLLGLGGAATIVAEPGLLLSRSDVSAGTAQRPVPAPATSVQPEPETLAVTSKSSPVDSSSAIAVSAPSTSGPDPVPATRSAASELPAADEEVVADSAPEALEPDATEDDPKSSIQAAFVFEPATAGHASRRPAVSEAPDDSAASETAGEPRQIREAPTTAAKHVAAAPDARQIVTRAPASRAASDPPVSVERTTRREFAPVNQDHTRRVRMLNANLQRALKTRNSSEIDRILGELETLVGPDSSYMLKMRAFTQLTLGGDTEHAMNLLREVLVRDPGDEDAVLNMAVAEIGIGEVAEARTRLEALAVAHPGDKRIDKLLRSIQ